MHGTAGPRELSNGWFYRTFLNGVRLSLLAPVVWLWLYVGLPVLSSVSDYIPLSMALSAIAL